MSNTRAWLFRVLVLASGGLLLYSWFLPWWSLDVFMLDIDVVVIHPWGLEQRLGAWAEYIAEAEMPVGFAPVMWAYLGIAIVALLFSLWAKDKELKLWKVRATLPSLIIGIVGFSYIVVLVTMVIFAAIKTGDFNAPLQGRFIADTGYGITSAAKSALQLGYWLAWGTGLSLVVLALLRNKIIGKPYLEALSFIRR